MCSSTLGIYADKSPNIKNNCRHICNYSENLHKSVQLF